MLGKTSREVTDTKSLPAHLHDKVQQYLRPVVILSVALYAHLTGEAHACSAWTGQTGVASYYGPGMAGRRTATGEAFDMWAIGAAHSCLPLGTRIRVTVLNTGRSLIVTVNDRMPSQRRILDLSIGAARALGIVSRGVATVYLAPVFTGAVAAQ